MRCSLFCGDAFVSKLVDETAAPQKKYVREKRVCSSTDMRLPCWFESCHLLEVLLLLLVN